MADKGGSSVFPVLLLGGAAYLGYKLFLSPATSAAQSSGTPSPATSPTGPAPSNSPVSPGGSTGSTPALSSYNSLDATFQRFNAQVQANLTDPAITQQQGALIATPDVFNYYLAQVSNYPLDSNGMAAVFPNAGRKPISLGAFWSGVSQYLAQNKGLSGIGGRGLAGLILSRGRR